MSSSKQSLTLCELYQVFKNLEEAFGFFADVLVGVKCQGTPCKTEIDLNDELRDALGWLEENRAQDSDGGGGLPCRAVPCQIQKNAFTQRVEEFALRTPATANAVAELVKILPKDKIEYMTQPAGRK